MADAFKLAVKVCLLTNLETTPSEKETSSCFISGKILGSHFVRKLFPAVFIAD